MTIELKRIVASRIDTLADELIEISHDIHAHPELAFKEHHASDVLCGALGSAGLAVKRSVYGLETAFESEFAGGIAGPLVALLAEYAGDRSRVRTQPDCNLRAGCNAGSRGDPRPPLRHGTSVGDASRGERRRQGTDGARRCI